MKIYVASSWRNLLQVGVVHTLRAAGHEVYDFRNPAPGSDGFRWTEIDPEWQAWTPERYRECLEHPIAIEGFNRDMDALRWCDVCVLVLPCGRSAHLEAGWAAGAGKSVLVLQVEPAEPELMNRMTDGICTTLDELLERLEHVKPSADLYDAAKFALSVIEANGVFELSERIAVDRLKIALGESGGAA